MPAEHHTPEAIGWLGRLLDFAVAGALAGITMLGAWVTRLSKRLEDDRVNIAILQRDSQDCKEDRVRTTEKLDRIYRKLDELTEAVYRLVGRSDG